MSEFPITAEALGTVAGCTAFCLLMATWLKRYLTDWRYTNLLVLALGIVASEVALLVRTLGHEAVTGDAVLGALLVGVLAASVATLGYESVTNLAGKLGEGKRSDEALLATARKACDESNR